MTQAEVTAGLVGDFDSGLVFCWAGRVVLWLPQGERDGGSDEFEGLPLGAGRLGEHRDGDLGSGHRRGHERDRRTAKGLDRLDAAPVGP